jgi:branched-chain amino acid transport system ATP-binding protein
MLLMSRALIMRPKLMLVDEISEGLQPTMVQRVGEALKKLRAEEGTTIFLVEQNVGFVADVCDRIALIKIGSIAETRDITPGGETRNELLELMRV